jgi:hypothetical protein
MVQEVAKPTATPGKAGPPQLSTESRGEEKRLRLQRQMEEEQRLAAEAAIFRAREFTVSHPPAPKMTPAKAATPAKAPALSTLARQSQREAFDAKIKEREALKEQTEQERLMELKRQEEAEVQRLRRQMIFRATKIKHYRLVMSSDIAPRPLTRP